MSTYYVSTQRGLDTNAGTSPSAPWKTIVKSVTAAVSGDTVYIGPGTYREKPSNTVAGTSGAPIQFIGDPDVQYVTGDIKGIVRVTGCSIAEVPSAGVVWSRAVDYVTLKNILIDGSTSTYCVTCGTATNGRININLVVIGYSGIQYGINANCFVISANIAITGAINTNCVAYSGMYGFDTSTNTNCLATAGSIAFRTSTNYNCTVMGSYYGYYATTLAGNVCQNCVAIGTNYPYYNGTLTNCFCMCNNTAYTSSGAGLCVATNCLAIFYVTKNTLNITGTIVDGLPVLFNFNNMQKILEGFDPWMFEGIKQNGNNSAIPTVATDILGRARRMIGGVLDRGAYALSKVSPDFTNYLTSTPGISISQIGMEFFKIPAKANTPITIKVQTKWIDSTTLPQILLRGETISEQTATNTSASNVWQQLSVSATPTKDEVLTLVLYGRDSATSAMAYFSDISVS